jgi:hypothetical protein
MQLTTLRYNDLDTKGLEQKISKVEGFLRLGDFRAADACKMAGTSYYRARLDDANRLLFSLASYRAEKVILLLEVIRNHNYNASRFLRGAAVDESKIQLEPAPRDEAFSEPLRYFDKTQRSFCLLDKILIFDPEQSDLYQAPLPLVIVGSAGSGKTAITLEKMKRMTGSVLYVTQSPYLVENSRTLYLANGYENEDQEVSFLSYHEFLATYVIPEGRELTYREFSSWFRRHQNQCRFAEAGQVYEEFKGVITGSVIDKPCRTLEEYLALGIKQSIFSGEERRAIYELFEKYRAYLKELGCYDINVLSYDYLGIVEPTFDAVVVDEVQDLTMIQLFLIMQSLKAKGEFILTGDANQIVHPNFFSWSKIKSLFYTENVTAGRELIRILSANYRSSSAVTELANRILKVKQARFGSIDRESNYLIKPALDLEGGIRLLPDSAAVKKDISDKTSESTLFAVLVMHDEDKDIAAAFFKTPLIFSIREAKGLEYENVILFNMISGNAAHFGEIIDGVTPRDLEVEKLEYARSSDKADKSLEIYKFYINALYVAVTRSVKNLYIIERDHQHRLLSLLHLKQTTEKVAIKEEKSSREDWQREAHRLDLQGKKEQADKIRRVILKTEPVPWEVLTQENLGSIMARAFEPKTYAKKEQRMIYAYGVAYYDDTVFAPLVEARFSFANERGSSGGVEFVRRRFMPEFDGKGGYQTLFKNIARHGIDYRNPLNMTPLMTAARLGEPELVKTLVAEGASSLLTDLFGQTAFDHAMREACRSAFFAREILPQIYDVLAPSSLNVKVGSRLIKLDRRMMEYHLVTAMLVMIPWVLQEKVMFGFPAFQSLDLCEMFASFAPSVLLERRKSRAYISSILAKNEIDKESPYNRKLFLRVPQKRGYYLLNPLLEVEQQERWINIYDLAGLTLLRKVSPSLTVKNLIDQIFKMREQMRTQKL